MCGSFRFRSFKVRVVNDQDIRLSIDRFLSLSLFVQSYFQQLFADLLLKIEQSLDLPHLNVEFLVGFLLIRNFAGFWALGEGFWGAAVVKDRSFNLFFLKHAAEAFLVLFCSVERGKSSNWHEVIFGIKAVSEGNLRYRSQEAVFKHMQKLFFIRVPLYSADRGNFWSFQGFAATAFIACSV